MSEHDDQYGDALRSALHAEANDIVPAGDGLDRIRARIANRRTRWLWLRPAVAVVGAGAVGAAAYLGVSLSSGGGVASLKQHEHPATGGAPTPTATTDIGPSASPSPATSQDTIVGIWPFQTASQADRWQRGDQIAALYDDPKYTAVAFLKFLGHPEVDKVMSVSDKGYATAVTLGQTNPDSGRTTKVTTVWLKQVGSGTTGSGTNRPWDVQEATADLLTIGHPTQFGSASSPMSVSGHITGIDESITVDLVSPSTGRNLNPTTPHVPAGGENTPWQTTLTFHSSSDRVGIVVAYTGGHVSAVERLAVRAITLPMTPKS